MDARQKLAVQVVCAMACSERKKKKKIMWIHKWIGRRDQRGLALLQRELEVDDRDGYREMLRMYSEEFDMLLALVEHRIRKQNTQMRRAITPRERLCLTLRFLATGESFKSLRLQYRIGTSTVSKIVFETCEALYQAMKDDFLKTPTTEAEWRTIAQEFEDKCQFPHCLGAIDGKHINIQPPANSGSVFWNYKGRFSIVLMAVVDAHCKFIYASVGVQGRVPDAGLFAHSDLFKGMDRGLMNFPPPEKLKNTDEMMPFMLVGDDAFPLRSDLMKPYPYRQMDHDQRIYNYRMSRARRVVENAFGILANRLRVFRSTICLEPDKVTTMTMASLCIHNFLRGRRSVAYTPPAFVDWENADHSIVDGAWRQDGLGTLEPLRPGRDRNPPVAAKVLRNKLRDYFVSPAGSVSWQENHI